MKNYLLRNMTMAVKICIIAFCFLNVEKTFAQGTGFIKCYADKDGDGYGDPNDFTLVDVAFFCLGVDNDQDCNDNDNKEHPGQVWYKDSDNDGLSSGQTVIQCERPFGYKALNELKNFAPLCNFAINAIHIIDCDDFTISDINTGFKYWFVDNDGDGFAADKEHYIVSCANPIILLNSPLPVADHYIGFNLLDPVLCNLSVDCNDSDPSINPLTEWYLDGDGDGFPLNNTPELITCQAPEGFYKTRQQLISLDVDCNDRDAAVFPRYWDEDKDGDGLITGFRVFSCTQPEGHILPPDVALIDCDDTDPDATFSQDWYPDVDGDRHGNAAGFVLACKRPTGYFKRQELLSVNDCNDNNGAVHPSAIEFCNGIDDDCDGQIDETYCCPTGNILYVNAANAGLQDGTSWVKAFKHLQDALEVARRCNNVEQIWVAGGSYYPDEGGIATPGSDLGDAAFQPRGGLAIYGGFAGTESLFSQRVLSSAESILSGEIQQDGLIENNTNNVVILDNISTSFVLDGFTIRDGYSSVVLSLNKSRGAGILVLNSTSVVQIRNCTFRNNVGNYGAAIANVSSMPEYINCVITGNTTMIGNGAIWNDNASPRFVNCSIADNAITGNDFIIIRNTGSAFPTIINSIVRGTSPAMDGGSPLVFHSYIQNESVWPGIGNINSDPLFVDEANGNLRLQQGSPAFNAGIHDLLPINNTIFNRELTDIEGRNRNVGMIDMGAYESPYACSDPSQWVIDKDGDGYYPGEPVAACDAPGEGYVVKSDELPGDCNDNDANINLETIWLLDVDGDGYHEKLYIALPSCAAPQDGRNYINNSKGQDCNDNDATYNPETVWVKDADGDGYYIGEPYTGCFFIFQPGYVQKTNQQSGDCNDNDANINPETIWLLDVDGDGYHEKLYIALPSCAAPQDGRNYINNSKGQDCNDNDATYNPETVWVKDADGDGYYIGEPYTGCFFIFQPGYVQKTNQQSGDCNDNDANINPETIWLLDVDGDGYHEKLYIALPSCAAPQDGRNYINNSKGQDCNDNDATYNPETVWVKDADGDGYYIGEPYTGCFFIFQPGYVQKTNQQPGDCDDGKAAIHVPIQYYVDGDKDGYGSTAIAMLCSATAPVGYSTNNTDCNDNVNSVHPGTPIFTCPSNRQVNLVGNCKFVVPDLTVGLTSTNNCSNTNFSQNPAAGTSLSGVNNGTYNVTVIATDANGYSSSCTVILTAKDSEKPVANCKNITVHLGANGLVNLSGAQINNNSTDNCQSSLSFSVNRASFNSDDLGNACEKTFNVVLTATDGAGNSSTCSATVTVKRRITKLVYNGVTQGQYSDLVNLSATLYDITDGLPGVAIADKTVTFILGAQSASDTYGGIGQGTNSSGIADGTLVLNQDPAPAYTIGFSFAGDGVYCASSASTPFDIKPEDLCSKYNGQLSVKASVLSKTNSSAKVLMSVGIADATDGNAGDLTKAKVEFNYGSGWITVPVQILNAAKTIGNATYTTIINFTGDGSTLNFNYRISGYYQINQECSDNGQSVINVYKPQGEFITGGGYIESTNRSVGVMPADEGRRANFGFNVKYNKKNTNLQGNISYIFRRKVNDVVRLYQVKGNSMTSLVVNMNDALEAGMKTAVFIGKCNVTDVTDPLAPVTVAGTGNSTMQVIITDATETGVNDKYGITIWTPGNQVFHSSNWEATKTTKLVLGSGDVVVGGTTSEPLTSTNNTGTGSSTPEVDRSTTVEKTKAPGEDLKVTVMPNPSSTNFRIVVNSNDLKEPVKLLVTDMLGRMIETRITNAGQLITIGDKYISGTYAVRILQGRKTKQLTLIKLSD